MGVKRFFRGVPLVPVSVLLFYIGILLLWSLGVILSPLQIFVLLEGLYDSYGLVGLFLASFFEGIVYLGLYIPGSLVVALAVFLSDGSVFSLLAISVTVAFALTLTSMFNYLLGAKVSSRRGRVRLSSTERNRLSKGLVASMLHPNILAFYFFISGMKRRGFLKVFFVPLIIVPYGLLLGALLFLFKDTLRSALESPYIMISLILLWVVLAFIMEKKK